jgi:hypothetical protein
VRARIREQKPVQAEWVECGSEQSLEKDARPERLHPRLLTYFERLHNESGIAPQQYVVVLEPGKGRLPGTYRTGRLQLDYHVIHLWDEPPDRLMADPGLSPLAVLAHRKSGETALSRVEEMLERVTAVDDPERRRQLTADAATFATIALDSTTLFELLKRYTAMPLYVEECRSTKKQSNADYKRGLQTRTTTRPGSRPPTGPGSRPTTGPGSRRGADAHTHPSEALAGFSDVEVDRIKDSTAPRSTA